MRSACCATARRRLFLISEPCSLGRRSAELSTTTCNIISQINWNRQTAALWRCGLIHTVHRASYMIDKQHAAAGSAFNAAYAAV